MPLYGMQTEQLQEPQISTKANITTMYGFTFQNLVTTNMVLSTHQKEFVEIGYGMALQN